MKNVEYKRWATRNRASRSDSSVAVDFHWIGAKDRQRIYHLLLQEARNGKEGTPYEYTLLMPPLSKAHQILSRDEKHRKWDGYTWVAV